MIVFSLIFMLTIPLIGIVFGLILANIQSIVSLAVVWIITVVTVIILHKKGYKII